MRPPPKLTISEWADRERRLDSQSSAEPGRWYTSRAEYQRGMMDACSDPKNKEVVIMSAAQLGKSEALLNIIGYHIDNDPCPMLMLQPSLDMAQAFSKDRVANGLRPLPAYRIRLGLLAQGTLATRRCIRCSQAAQLLWSGRTAHQV